MSWGVRGFQYLGYTCHRHRFLHTGWLFTACSITLLIPTHMRTLFTSGCHGACTSQG